MNKGHLKMSEKERKRTIIFDRVEQGHFDLKEAAETLELSNRQTLRSFRRYAKDGAAGLVHRSRGRNSNRARADSFKQAVLDRYRESYNAYGPTLAAEMLAREDKLVIDHETLRRWLLKAGLWTKQRKRRKHRVRREPKAHFGELVQMDGSHHRWFGPAGKETCLIVMIDDATKTRLAYMAEEETIEACMKTLRLWIGKYGVPAALYTDRKNIFVADREPTPEEQLAGRMPLTVFGLACEKLGIRIIRANSPQAKGRVERSHGVYQDRLVKELAFRKITTLEGANALLRGGFDDELNRKFGVAPTAKEDFHRPPATGLNLDNVFCVEHTRTLQNDWTVRLKNRVFQILSASGGSACGGKDNKPLPRPKQRIVLREHLDGSVSLWNGEQRLKARVLEHNPTKQAAWAARLRRPGSDEPLGTPILTRPPVRATQASSKQSYGTNPGNLP